MLTSVVTKSYTDTLTVLLLRYSKGSVTPVVVESLSVLEVEAEIARLGKKARDGN